MMKILKITGFIFCAIIFLLFLIIGYIKLALPNVGPAPDIRIETTPERLSRGKYLALNVSGCIYCHSKRDESRFSEPVLEGTYGQGGEIFPTETGKVVAPNITPYALSRWTDGEIYRAMVCGVNKTGKALFPIMPYQNFAQMDQEDIYSIIAYIRSLKPVINTTEETQLNFPMNIIVNTIPTKAVLGEKPGSAKGIEYGRYVITASNCRNCHSPMLKGKYIKDQEFSGGNSFMLPNGEILQSANITPDKKTGIGSWNKEYFIRRFKAALDSGYSKQVKVGDIQTIMPWTMYSQMDETDLGAIYDYLQSVKPVRKSVVKYTGVQKR